MSCGVSSSFSAPQLGGLRIKEEDSILIGVLVALIDAMVMLEVGDDDGSCACGPLSSDDVDHHATRTPVSVANVDRVFNAP